MFFKHLIWNFNAAQGSLLCSCNITRDRSHSKQQMLCWLKIKERFYPLKTDFFFIVSFRGKRLVFHPVKEVGASYTAQMWEINFATALKCSGNLCVHVEKNKRRCRKPFWQEKELHILCSGDFSCLGITTSQDRKERPLRIALHN